MAELVEAPRTRDVEERSAIIMDNLPGMAFIKDENGRYVYANETFERVAGLPRGGACGKTDRDIWPEELAEGLRTGDRLVARQRTPIETLEEFPHSGRAREWLLTKFPVPGLDNSRPVVAGVGIDVTARQQSETKVRQERDRAQMYLDVAGVAIVAFDPLGTVTLINKKGCELLEGEESGIIGRDWFASFVPRRVSAAAKRRFERLVGPASSSSSRRTASRGCASRDVSRRRKESHDSFEGLVLTTAGRERIVAWHASTMIGPSGAPVGVLASGEDVTHRKSLEEELQRSRRLEAIGRLAGGVAHDFNNLLTVIIGHGERLLGKLHDGYASEEALQIMNAGRMAAALTRRLLAFGREEPMQARAVDVNAVIRKLERLLTSVVGDGIVLEVRLAPDLGHALSEPAMLEQGVMNMIMNSSDAMPDGGRITIETRNAIVTGDDTGPVGVEPGRYIALRLSDTGCGMDAETMSRVFEPFFTTKERGRGTGLGLSTVYGVIRNSGGRIWVESEESKGTTFSVWLKRVDKLPVESSVGRQKKGHAAALHGNVAITGGRETVLIAEDNAIVRDLARAVLSDCGYRVLQASGGEEALQICNVHRGPVHVLLADVVMPGMGGRELFDRLSRERPGLRAVFVSGYSEDATARGGWLPPGTAFQEKPFGPETLAQKVRMVLDWRPEGQARKCPPVESGAVRR